MNHPELQAWLQERNYRPATIKQTLGQVTSMLETMQDGQGIPEYTRLSAARVIEFAEVNDIEFYNYLVSCNVAPTQKKLKAQKKERVYVAQSVEEEDWGRFQDALAESNDERDRVIEVICVTGMRVGDALRLKRKAIHQALKYNVPVESERKGGKTVQVPIGVRSSWERLQALLDATQAETVAALLCPKNPSTLPADAPYQQINRRLKWWATELGINGRMHTHRMRRTFAVRIHRMTKDITVVAQGLNNGIQASMQYLDESRADELAGLQQRLRGRV